MANLFLPFTWVLKCRCHFRDSISRAALLLSGPEAAPNHKQTSILKNGSPMEKWQAPTLTLLDHILKENSCRFRKCNSLRAQTKLQRKSLIGWKEAVLLLRCT